MDGSDESTVVSISGVTLKSPSLSEDGKTLTLTSPAAIDVKNATVEVQPVQTKADANVKTEKYVSLLTYKDEVAPTIASVEALTNGAKATELTVKASEPIQSALAKVNGNYVSVNFNNTDTAKISGVSLETGKSHTIELINLKDIAGNNTVSTSASFTVTVDSVAPVATLSQKEDNQILVTFNKKMDVNSVKTALADGSVKDEALGAVTTGAVTEVADSKGTQFIIPVSDSLYTNDRDSRTLNVVLSDSIKDHLGNKLAATTQKVTLTKDTAKPVSTGYNVVKDADGKVKAIEVNFSEGLAASAVATGQTLHQVTDSIVNEDGVLETTKFANYKSKAVSAGDTKVVFEAAVAEDIEGKYAFSFKKELVKDQAQTANKSNAFNYTIDFGLGEKETEFELVSAASTSATSNIIKVDFGTAVKGGAVAGSATDPANYTLAGKPLPADTSITLDSAQKVATITLPVESVEKDDQAAVFTVANVKNTAGTKTVKSYQGTLKVADNVNPVLESAKILDNKTIELTYSEAITSLGTDANVFDSFEIKNGSTTALPLLTDELKANNVSGFNNKIVITIDQDASPSVPASIGSVDADANNTGSSTLSTGGEYTGTEDVEYEVVVKTLDSSNKPATVTIKDASGVLADDVSVTPGSALSNAALKGITVTLSDATSVVGDKFTFSATAAKSAVATVLDLDKDITVETKDSSVVKDNSAAKNPQKAGVKVTVSK